MVPTSPDPGPQRASSNRGASFIAVVCGVALLGATLLHPLFRDTDGYLVGEFALPLGAAVAAFAFALTRRAGWARFGAWAALGLLGQGAVLALVLAGPVAWYQHLRPWPEVAEGVRSIALVVLVAQAATLILAGRPALREAVAWIRTNVGGPGIAFLVGIFVLTAATLSRDPRVYVTELVVAALVQGLQLWTAAAAARAVPDATARAFGERVGAWLTPPAGSPDRFLPALALGATVLTAVLNVWAYGRFPHVPDEVVYLFHARYFAAGFLDLPLPPVPAGFETDLLAIHPDRWFSPVPPGWPAVLAIGAKVGLAWLVNPVLSGLTVLMVPRLTDTIYEDRRVGRVAAVLLATSPWFLFLGMSFMTHTLSLAAAVAAAWLTGLAIRQQRLVWCLPAGTGIGLVGLVRPLEGVLVAAALGLWSLFGGRHMVRAVGRTAALAASTLATTALQFPYNRHLTGGALRFPIMDYTDRVYGEGRNAMGFGPDRGLDWGGLDPLPGHGLVDVLINGNMNLFQLNIELLGWSIGSLFALTLLFVARRSSRADWGMVAAAALVIGVHSFYWFSGGPDFGARYWYLVILPLIVLSARSLLEFGSGRRGGRSWAAAAVLVTGALTVFVPWRAVDKYHRYRDMGPDVRVLAQERDFGDALVLVRGEQDPDYQGAVVLNPLDLEGPGPIYAWDRSPDVRAALLEAYPERPVWLVEGPTLTGRGWQVVAGPIVDRTLLDDFPIPAAVRIPPSAPWLAPSEGASTR